MASCSESQMESLPSFDLLGVMRCDVVSKFHPKYGRDSLALRLLWWGQAMDTKSAYSLGGIKDKYN